MRRGRGGVYVLIKMGREIFIKERGGEREWMSSII